MKRGSSSILSALVVLPICAIAVGCGGSTIKVKGSIAKSGSALTPGKGERLRIVFYPADQQAGPAFEGYAANVKREDGTFEVPGKQGKGIPPGKYRITIELVRGDADQLKGVFGPEKSPIVRELSKSQEVVIDLDNPSG